MSSFDVSMIIRLVDQVSGPAKALSANLKAIQKQTQAATVAGRRMGGAWRQSVIAATPLMKRSFSEITKGVTGLGAAAALAGRQAIGTMKFIGGLGAAAGLSATGLFAMSSAWSRSTAEQSRFAKTLGLSLQDLRELAYAANESGVSTDTLTSSLKRFSANLGDLKVGRGPLHAFLEKANPRLAKELAKANVSDAFDMAMDVLAHRSPEMRAAWAKAFGFDADIARMAGVGKSVKAMQQELKDAGFDPGPIDDKWGRQTAKAAAAYEKKTGRSIVGVDVGSARLKAARNEARKLLGELTEQDARTAEEAARAQVRLAASLQGLRDSILSKIASPDMTNGLADLIKAHRDAISGGVLSFYRTFTDILSAIDWRSVGAGLKSIGDGMASIARFVGGWDKFLMGLAALRFSKPIIMAATGLMHIFNGLGLGMAGLGVGAATFIGKFGRVAGVVGLVASAALLLYRHWDKIAPAWQRVVEAGKEVIEALRPIAEACDAIPVSLTGMTLNQLWDGFDLAVADQITSKLQALADALDTVAKAIKVIREAPGLLGGLLTPGGGAAQLGAEIGKEKKSGAPSVPIVPRGFPTLPPLVPPPFGSPQPQAPGFGFKSEPQRSPGSGYITSPKADGQTSLNAGTDLIGLLKSKLDEMIGGDTLAAAAANAPVRGQAPAGITIEAQGPSVTVRQAPPNISISVGPISVTGTDASPEALAEKVGRGVERKMQGAMYDWMNGN